MSRIPETRSAPLTHSKFVTKREVPPHVYRLDSYHVQFFIRKCSEHLVSLTLFEYSVYFRTEVCTRMIRHIHIPGTNSSSSTCTRSNTRVLLLRAVACSCSTFAPDRDSRVLEFCRCPPRMWSRRILHRYFLFLFRLFRHCFSKSTRINPEIL